MSELPEDLWEYELLEVPEDIIGVSGYAVLFHPDPEVTKEVWVLRIVNDGSHKVIKQHLHQGYMKLQISLNEIRKQISVHRLVAFACFGRFLEGQTVDHIKSDEKLNNHPSNLRYATRSEQSKNRKITKPNKKKMYMDEFTKEQLGEIRDVPFDIFQKNGYKITSTGLFIRLTLIPNL